MNKISGTGQFRSDGTQSLTQGVMTIDAVARMSSDDPSTQTISISIHEKLPLMNGQTGCEAEIQLTPDQASRLAKKLIEMVGQAESAAHAPSVQQPVFAA